MTAERRRRSIFKSLSWRLLATSTTITLIYLFTQELVLSLGVGALEMASKLGLYYVHERAWTKFGWGLN